MLADAYDYPLSTSSAEARDAYVRACGLMLTFYPGEAEAFEHAIAADPRFALAHVAKAQMLARRGNRAAAQEAMAAAATAGGALTEREASHLAFFGRVMSGQLEAAIDALRVHLRLWPRDAVVLSTAANPNGLLGMSGRIGQKHEIAVLMDALAPHYGDDPWFLAHHAMALSEDGRRDEGRPKAERSIEAKGDNAHAAHAYAHICYEDGQPDIGRRFLAQWLATYPRDGFFHGHLSWHRALGELELGSTDEALRLYREAFCPGQHSGGPQQKISDAGAFLWRAELAGQGRDRAAWQALHDFAKSACLRAGNGLEDLHVLLVQAVAGNHEGLAERVRQMQDLARQGRYPSGPYLPALATAFAAFERQDYAAAIDALEPLMGQNERIGGSRAQHDIVEFTLLKAYVNAGRPEAARDMIRRRRPGPSGLPVAGVPTLH